MAEKKMLNVPLVKFGNERCTLEVPEGQTYGELYKEIPNAANLDVMIKGQPIQEFFEEEVSEEVTIYSAPKKIAQGK